MPAPVPLYQEVLQRFSAIAGVQRLRRSSVQRLALLVTGIIAAESCVLAKVAARLLALGLTKATVFESVERRLRRTLNDAALDARTCYEPLLCQVIDWPQVLSGSKRVVLIVDESHKGDELHLFRLSLAYWGGAVPLTWTLWQQNVALPKGAYWSAARDVLDRVASLLPAGLEVTVVADRAYDIPTFIDLLRAYGWHWIVRCKAKGSLRFLDQRGQEWALSKVIGDRVGVAGRRWKARGQVFKDAGWRQASVIAIWAPGEAEALVVLSDLPPKWEVLALFARRAWVEPGFRNDKKRGWHWEESQVRGIRHNNLLLLATAWATLVTLCLGVYEAKERAAALAKRRICGKIGKPEHARQSVFTLGLRRAQAWLYRTVNALIPWLLPDLDAPSWFDRWHAYQSRRYIFKTVLP